LNANGITKLPLVSSSTALKASISFNEKFLACASCTSLSLSNLISNSPFSFTFISCLNISNWAANNCLFKSRYSAFNCCPVFLLANVCSSKSVNKSLIS
jgi:hypothetical protein